MKNLLIIFSKIEFFYITLLPYLGYIGCGMINKTYTLMPILGIGMLFLYQILAAGLWEYQLQKNPHRNHLFIMLPILLTSLNYIFLGEGIWLFFIEKTLLEVAAIILAFTIILFFFKNSSGVSSWEFLGILPLLIVAILVASVWELADVWLRKNPYIQNKDYLYILNFSISFLLDFWWSFTVLRQVASGKIILHDLYSDDEGMWKILVQVGIWVLIIPIGLFLYFHFAK